MKSLGRDLKAETLGIFAMVSTSLTAAGTGDNTEITGATINKASYGKAESAVFVIPCRAVLTATKSLNVTANIEHSADGSSWADLTTASVVLTLTSAGGGTETGVARVGLDLNKANQYIRLMVTPDLTHSGTDTAVVGGAVAVFGGLQNI